jgi:NADPH-dependent 2,4-dienoyl-CoA reductase/sulfur reductase-like enzyme
MLHVAVIGSGPAGYYTAEACQKAFGDNVRVDIIDRLPVPFGLIRSGVAPDHQSIKVSSCCPHGRGYPDFILLRHDLLLRRSLQVHIIHPGVQQSLRGRAFVVAVGPIACRSMGIH